MRIVGIFANTLEALQPVEVQVAGMVREQVGSTAVEQIVQPSAPRPLSIYATKDLYPPIDVHHAPSGSVTALDGELYNADIFPNGTSASSVNQTGHAALLGNAIDKQGYEALARADAAAMITHYDAPREMLTIARDAIGNVPVFYTERSDVLMWASDLPSLLPFIKDPRIDPAALDFFMASGYIPAPWSMVSGIHRLAPGHVLVQKLGGDVHNERYWRQSGQPPLSLTEYEIVEQLEVLFPKAVKRRATDAKTTGVLVSAGVDSKAILAAATNVLGEAPKSFTFEYIGHDGDLNESTHAKACADFVGSDHHTIPFQPTDLPSILPSIVQDFGEPFSYGLHTAVLGAVREFGVKDLLCGTGADGWFAGFQELNATKYQRQNPVTQLGLRAVTSMTRRTESALRAVGLPDHIPGISDRARRFHSGIWTAKTGLTFYLSEYIAPHWMRRRLYCDPWIADYGREQKRHMRDAARAPLSSESLIAAGKIISTRFYGADMMQNWNHWSARSIGATIRSPFYDLELIDLITRLPLDRPGKPELRKYAASMMPHDMAYTKKIAQSVPITDWFHGPLKDFVSDSLGGSTLKKGGVFDSAAALNLWNGRQPKSDNIDWVYWNMIIVSEWQKSFGVGAPDIG